MHPFFVAVCFISAGLAEAASHESDTMMGIGTHGVQNGPHIRGMPDHGLDLKWGSRHLMEDDGWDDGGKAVVNEASIVGQKSTADTKVKPSEKAAIKDEKENTSTSKDAKPSAAGARIEAPVTSSMASSSPPKAGGPSEDKKSDKGDVKRSSGVHIGVPRHLNASEDQKEAKEPVDKDGE
jgi:hypothetical protein